METSSKHPVEHFGDDAEVLHRWGSHLAGLGCVLLQVVPARGVMQTFLPHPDFDQSARALDNVRLGKQRVEVLQVLRALTRPVYGWQHHPAVLMWRGFEEALGAYGVAVCREWCRRGFADTCERKILDDLAEAGVAVPPRSQADLARAGALPPWIGDDRVHLSHRSALVRKHPEWYRTYFPDDPPDLPYTWPVTKNMTVDGA